MFNKKLSILYWVPFLLLARPASACNCESLFSTCKEVRASNFVFIGTVELIEPKFLSGWNAASPAALRLLNDTYVNAQEHPSAHSLARLKETYLKTFPELDEHRKRELLAAKRLADVAGLFYSALDRGMRIRFQVKTFFKSKEDDDDDSDTEEQESTMEVFTPFGDCGFDFQEGETYLVYASRDEDSDYVFTGSCTRTRRLSDAGEDLAYLYFYKNTPDESGRLEGFTTSDALQSPVPGATIELESEKMKRFTRSDPNGRFLFDGLAEGDYRVSALVGGSPLNAQLLAGPVPIHIEEKACAQQVLLLPRVGEGRNSA